MSGLSTFRWRPLAATTVLAVVLAGASAIAPAAGAGADGGRACIVAGTPRADRLVGTRGPDLLCGRGGDDAVLGKQGADVVRAGGGDDRRAGDPPVVRDVTVSRERIDVSDGPVDITVTARVADGSGARDVTVRAGGYRSPTQARLVSGDRRAGRWSATLTVPGWMPVRDLRPRVTARDRAGARGDAAGPLVQVANDRPDGIAPEARLLSPRPEQVVDVRRGGEEVTVRVRLTDERSGVHSAEASIYEPRLEGALRRGEAGGLRRVSGTARDGIWEGEVLVPRSHFGGVHQVVVLAADRASVGTRFRSVTVSDGEYGADEWNSAYWTMRAFPDGRGEFRVLGQQRPDVLPPLLVDAAASPAVVETSQRGGEVRVTADVVDDRSGVNTVYVDLVRGFYGDPGTDRYHATLRLARGTARDGRWRASIPIPRGARDGRLWMKVTVIDRAQMTSEWISDTLAGAWPFLPIASDPSVVVQRAGDQESGRPR